MSVRQTIWFLVWGLVAVPSGRSAEVLIGWNDLGMHCMDGNDFSVFSILPPYNTIHAQLIRDGHLVTSAAGLQVTYEAVADPSGSINRTSIGKGNFWEHVEALFGANPAPDMGLAGFAMPGADNLPRRMEWDPALNGFTAEGIPLSPYDDSGAKQYYPLMRLVAKDASGHTLATTRIVLPVSDEMDCRACHRSGGAAEAKPAAGWAWDCDAERDYKLNILRLHDEFNDGAAYRARLTEAGYHPSGLHATVVVDHQPVLCARCHASNALPGTGLAGVPPLTQAIHSRHAYVTDPDTGLILQNSLNRATCYRCHPGQETRCLRGAMGNAVAANGDRSIQCQSCHGSMLAVGAAHRTGWLEEPNCQACHTGTALRNNGRIRYRTALEPDGGLRQAVNDTFATQPNTPAPGFSLYRFSTGHGGLQCEACHGSPHAEYPASHRNDNLQNEQLQGHAGVLSECRVCHGASPRTVTGGPHGMHPVGQDWVKRHDDVAEDNPGQCRVCHGADYRGTVLSRSLADRTLSAFGAKTFWRGFEIGCYTCHRGPHDDDRNHNHAPVVVSRALTSQAGQPITIPLSVSDADHDPLQARIVQQPAHGTVALEGTIATYRPEPGFVGADEFTYAARDGQTDSNLGRVTLSVVAGACVLEATTWTPAEAAAQRGLPFRAAARVTGCADAATYQWTFDGVTEVPGADVCQSFATVGEHTWRLVVTAGDAQQSFQGVVRIVPDADVVLLQIHRAANGAIVLAWPAAAADFVVEHAEQVGAPADWRRFPGSPLLNGEQWELTVTPGAANEFFRLRRAP